VKLNTNISDGNRILFQVYPPSTFPNRSTECNSSQCPLHFSKGMLNWCKWKVHTLQALVRNFLPINNVATWSLVLQRCLLCCVFVVLELSLISLPNGHEWSDIKLTSEKKQRIRNLCSTRDQGCKLFTAILVNWWFFGREQYTKVGGMIAYLLTDCAFGTGGSHFVS
jgi:hypothetical protein